MKTNPHRVSRLQELIDNSQLPCWQNRPVGTPRQISRLIDVSHSTISRARALGKVRGYEIPGALYGIDVIDLLEYLRIAKPGRKPATN